MNTTEPIKHFAYIVSLGKYGALGNGKRIVALVTPQTHINVYEYKDSISRAIADLEDIYGVTYDIKKVTLKQMRQMGLVRYPGHIGIHASGRRCVAQPDFYHLTV